MTTASFTFANRGQAGRFLADKLEEFCGNEEVVVLALPRGGVPVAFEVARRLRAPLDIFLVRKLGVPQHEELAMGAIGTGGICFLNQDIVDSLGISRRSLDQVMARESAELHRREEVYRREASALSLRGKIVILIDDGLATGATMRAAILALRQHGPAEVIVAVPVASRDTYDKFRHDGIDIVCVETPDDFQGVGQWYEDFRQTTDDEVRDLLAAAALLTPVALAEKN